MRARQSAEIPEFNVDEPAPTTDPRPSDGSWHMTHRFVRALPMLSAAGLGLIPFCFVTRGLLGVSPDSTQYLATARSLLDGRGFSTIWWSGHWEPLTHFPPLYPFLIAAVSALGMTPTMAAWALQSLLLPLNAYFVGRCAARIAGGTADQRMRIRVLAALAASLSATWTGVYAMMWSEPLFMSFLMGTLVLLSDSIEAMGSPRGERANRQLVLAALAAGTATLTRYIGVALAGSCCLALLALAPGRPLARLRRAALFGIVALTPFALWVFYNRWRGAQGTDREVAFHPITGPELRVGVGAVSHWFLPFLPLGQPAKAGVVSVAVLLAAGAMLLVGVGLWRLTRPAGVPAGGPAHGARAPGSPTLAMLFLYFLGCYAAFLLVSISIVDKSTSLDDRMLSPALPLVIALVVGALGWLLSVTRAERGAAWRVARGAVYAFGATYFVTQAVGTDVWAAGAVRAGLGLETVARTAPALFDSVRHLPGTVRIYSNMPDAIYQITGRIVHGVPRRVSPTSLLPVRGYRAALDSLGDAVAPPTYVVFLDAGKELTFTAGEGDIEATLPVLHIDSLSGGRIILIGRRPIRGTSNP